MVDSTPLRCQKCGAPIGYVTLTPKSYLTPKPNVENLKVTATCMECAGERGLYRRNF